MSITDELRQFASHCAGGMGGDSLRHIADRIDAEHEAAWDEAYGNGVESVALPDMTAYVKLPVDADGVPIHIGDVVYDCNESPSEKFSVAIMELNKWGWSLLDSYGERNEPGQCHHYRAPTVEDVLREFAANIADVLGGDDFRLDDSDELYAEYAAKLRLAGEGE